MTAFRTLNLAARPNLCVANDGHLEVVFLEARVSGGFHLLSELDHLRHLTACHYALCPAYPRRRAGNLNPTNKRGEPKCRHIISTFTVLRMKVPGRGLFQSRARAAGEFSRFSYIRAELSGREEGLRTLALLLG